MRKIQVVKSIDEDEIVELFPFFNEPEDEHAITELVKLIYDLPVTGNARSVVKGLNRILQHIEESVGDGLLSYYNPKESGVDRLLDIMADADRPKSLGLRVKMQLISAFLESFEEPTPASYLWDSVHDLIDQINAGIGVAEENDYDS